MRRGLLCQGSFSALNALLAIFIFNVTLQTPVDPDFGWHLRTGLDLLRNGWHMPLTDPYSHTMPEWPWVEHAWLTDGLLALTYRGLGTAGLLGIIVLFAAVTASAFLLAVARARAGWSARLVAVATVLWVARPFLGVRTQIITLLGVALLLRLWHAVLSGQQWPLWAMPLLFLAWANLHGGFLAGLLLFGVLWLASSAVRVVVDRLRPRELELDEPVLTWSQIGLLAVALGSSALVTVINPYGWRLHQEIVQSLTDRFMLETLHEWQPLSLDTHAGKLYGGYLAALGLTLALSYRRLEPVRWVALVVLLVLSIRHWRNIPLFLIASLPLWAEALAGLVVCMGIWVPALARYPQRCGLALTVASAVTLAALGPDHLIRVMWSGLAPVEFFRETHYPIEAIEWIKANREQLGSRLFNEYGHGGFLLWWLPAERIFIDGRMPAWRIGDRHILEDYLALTNWDPPALGVLDKYRVDWALVTRDSPLAQALHRALNWRAVYTDAKVTIYVRGKDSP